MMICEQCQQEMTASLVKCQHCGYNPALQRLDAWRERRQRRVSPAEEAQPVADNRRSSAKDATLIRFPKRPATPLPVLAAQPSSQEPPPWRSRLDARLQEIREQRALDTEPPPASKSARPAPEVFDQNPIVAKALNRIQRANYLQPITPLPHSRSSSAAELAPVLDTAPSAAPYIEAKAATGPTLSLATAAALPQVLADPFADLPAPILETEDDLLSELLLEPTPQPVMEVTPIEGPTTLEPASLGKRIAAAVIDAEIIASSLLPLFGAYFFLSGWFESPTILLPVAVAVVLTTLYFFVTYALAGRTMGMAWCNLHLASLSRTNEFSGHEEPSTVTFTIQQAVLRALGGTITMLLFPLNVICIARSDERLSISDYLSSTQVVRIKK